MPPVAKSQKSKATTTPRVAFFTPTVTARQPDGSIVARPGKTVVLNGDDEIGTAEAGRILGCSTDWVSRLCDMGRLVEGRDWRRISVRGNYRIKRSSVFEMANANAEDLNK